MSHNQHRAGSPAQILMRHGGHEMHTASHDNFGKRKMHFAEGGAVADLQMPETSKTPAECHGGRMAKGGHHKKHHRRHRDEGGVVPAEGEAKANPMATGGEASADTAMRRGGKAHHHKHHMHRAMGGAGKTRKHYPDT